MSCNEWLDAAQLGSEGEKRVEEYLRRKGYIIVKRNYRDRFGEIDIVAERDNTLAFVEVKTREKGALVSGIEAVNAAKQQRIYKTAMLFLQRINGEYEPRFDVAEVTVEQTEKRGRIWSLKYIENAF